MRAAKKIVPWLCAYVALAFFLAFPIPSFAPRGEYGRALEAWGENPTLENETAVRFQKHRLELIHVLRSAPIALLFTSLGYGAYFCVRFVLYHQQPRPNATCHPRHAASSCRSPRRSSRR